MKNSKNENTSSNPDSPSDGLDWLVEESKKHKNSEDFVNSLSLKINSSPYPIRDFEYTIGSLRIALGKHFPDQTSETVGNKCRFCGKTREDVHTMLVSGESSICDECVDTALYTLSQNKGNFSLRIAYFFYNAIASIGWFLNFGRFFKGNRG